MRSLRNVMLIIMTVMMTDSCVVELAESTFGEQEVTFTAGFSDTKTMLTEGNQVHWLPGDCISVSGASEAFMSDAQEQTALTKFTGSVLPADKYYAVYPFNSVSSWNGNVVKVDVLRYQTAVEGTFENNLNISAAHTSSDDLHLTFHNVLGYLKFSINNGTTPMKSVEVRTNAGEQISGPAELCFGEKDGLPVLSATDGFSNVILSLNETLVSGDYYIAMIPGVYTSGISLIFVDSNGVVAEKTIKSELTLEAGVIQNIGTISDLKFDSVEDVIARERDALIAIYESLGGDGWRIKDGWCSDRPVSEWYGVGVNERGFVTRLALEANNLQGHLSPEIGKLLNLEAINIKENSGVQSIPYELCRCTKLNTLSLPQIEAVPDRCLSQMFNLCELQIDLYKGIDLSFLDNLKSLMHLSLGVNGLDIPPSIGNMKQLYSLSLTGFAGPLPSSLGNLTSLTTLTITRGNLTGEIPSSFGCLQALTDLNLSNNNLTGEFPSALFTLNNLQSFDLSNNKYYGPIPKELVGMLNGIPPRGSLSVSFDISGNRFSGTIPKEIYEHPKWKYVWYAFYMGNLFDFTGVPIPTPDIVGCDIFGKTVDTSELLKERPYTLLYQYGVDFFGLSEMAFPNIESIKSLQERYPEKFNVILWGEEHVTADIVATTFTGAGLDDWTLCSTMTTEVNNISINNATTYPYNIYPFLSVVDTNGHVVFSSLDFNSYGKMNLLFDELCGEVDLGHYTSSDYSADGNVTTLQTATKGAGIDIVLMGDAYSDRLIADGTYAADMQYMMDAFFSEEPYKSYKDYFNVYSVTVVSENDVYETNSLTALDGWFGDGTSVGGGDARCFNYALKAISAERMNEAMIIVAMNSDAYAGTCYMYNPTYQARDYGSGVSISYFPKGTDAEMFAQLLHHEANGHGFAKLADEYEYELFGEVPADYVSQIEDQQDSWGWWKNVDFTNDPDQVRWSQFLGDSRYAGEGLGCFEGGLTYWTGVWRPTEDSIMRYNVGEFNAPSREAIYYRIHKLAYGDSWEYNYEDFVAYDAVNRTSASAPARSQRRNYVERSFEPTAPPVVVGKPWTEAK